MVHEFAAGGPIHTITMNTHFIHSSSGAVEGSAADVEKTAKADDKPSTLVATTGKTIHLLRSNDLTLIKTHTLPYAISSAALHPDGQLLVVGAKDDLWVRLIDASTAAEVKLEKGHHGPVHTVSFSPDGEIYATGSEDGTIRLWQTRPGHSYGLWQAASPPQPANGAEQAVPANGPQEGEP